MANNWEYDYADLYRQSPMASGLPRPAEQPPAPPPQPAKAPKRGSFVARTLGRLLMLTLCAAVGFGGGWLGGQMSLRDASAAPPSVSSAPPVSDGPSGTIDPAPSTGSGNLASASAGTGSLIGVSAKTAPSVVVVTTEQVTTNGYWGQYVESGAGSGVIIRENGYIITNNHVVSGASSIKVTLNDDTEYAATVVGTDSRGDIAVLKIDATGLTPATIGNSDALAVGQTVIAVGNPLGVLGGTVTNGIVSALNREINVDGIRMTLIQTNAAVSPGNSGGGLFNEAGELVGIVNAKSSGEDAEGLGFAIPINSAIATANDLIDTGYVTGRPALGITVINIRDAQTAAQYNVSVPGVYIQSVDEGGAAALAGLEPGDRFISVDDQLIETTNDLTNLLSTYQVGDTVTVQVSRNRQLITVKVTLGEMAG